MSEPGGRQKKFGAGNGTRTRDINLGKVALYQLSYSRSQQGGIMPETAGLNQDSNVPRHSVDPPNHPRPHAGLRARTSDLGYPDRDSRCLLISCHS